MRAFIAILLVSLAATAVPIAAQTYGSSEYGGGWAVPSLDMSSAISREVINESIMRKRAGLAQTGSRRGQPASAAVAASPFGSALALNGADPGQITAVQTSFVRSKALQQRSEAGILAEVKQRQPEAVAEYARVLGQQDMAKLFDKAVRGYGLRNNDIADTMAAYWLVSWVIANDARDFSPAAARAVRDQVKGGIARTSVAGLSLEKKHRLADEAIFNTLIATQAFEYAQSGKISKADYRRLADVTQKAFLGFGADLRALRLTDSGFVKR